MHCKFTKQQRQASLTSRKKFTSVIHGFCEPLTVTAAFIEALNHRFKVWGALKQRFRCRRNVNWQVRHTQVFLAVANITQIMIMECGYTELTEDEFKLFQVEYNDLESSLVEEQEVSSVDSEALFDDLFLADLA